MQKPSPELEKRTSGELTKPIPRVVIYGQIPYRLNPNTGENSGGYFSGSTEIINALTKYLDEHNLSDDGLVQSRQVDNIENAFFRGRRSDRSAPDNIPESIPEVVFVLPEMRGYDSGGYSISTPLSTIEALCREHDVPMVVVNEGTGLDELNAALNQISATQTLMLNSAPTQTQPPHI